jgi:hypothetical protein
MIGSRLGPKLVLEHQRTSDYYGVHCRSLHPQPLLSPQVVSRLIDPAPAGGLARPDKIPTDEEAPTSGGNKAKSRYIPSEVREHVYARAAYRCEFRGPDGTRCSSRTGLEIDHERPFAIYRSHDEHHLRLLCRRHNRFQAERVYGAEFIRAKIEEKKSQKDSAPSCARRSPTVTSPP